MSSFRELAEGNYRLNLGNNGVRNNPQDLDYLIETLRNPPPGTSGHKLLGYLYNYVPFVKQEHNLRLIVLSFLNNRVFFSAPVPSFEENYLIVEVFKLICDKKLKVSQPVLSVKSFYTIILTEINNFTRFNPIQNSWKALPILTGMYLSSDLRDELYLKTEPLRYRWFFRDCDFQISHLFKDCLAYTLSSSMPPEITNLAFLCLSLKFNSLKDNIIDYTTKIEVKGLVHQLVQLVFSKNTDTGLSVYSKFSDIDPASPRAEEFVVSNILNKPVFKHLNKLTSLIGAIIASLPSDRALSTLVASVMLLMLDFNENLNHFCSSSAFLNGSIESKKHASLYFSKYWALMKNILFSEMIIFRDVLTRFVYLGRNSHLQKFSAIANMNLAVDYNHLSMKIIHSLYYLHYILIAIGQGGFDTYNFVYYLSLELCLRNNSDLKFEDFSKFLIGNYQEVNLHYEALNRNYICRSKVHFVFGIWEYYIQEQVPRSTLFLNFIRQNVFEVVQNVKLDDIFLLGAGHSVLLAYFTKTDINATSIQQILSYTGLLIEQFPMKLSLSQLRIAIEILGKKSLSNPIIYDDNLHNNLAENFLNFVYFKCANTSSGIMCGPKSVFLKTSKELVTGVPSETIRSRNKCNESYSEERREPKTIREALIESFFNTIPYMPLTQMEYWLNKSMALIQSSNSEERMFLMGKLWKILSENLDLNRCEIAYNWWFRKRPATHLGSSPISLHL